METYSIKQVTKIISLHFPDFGVKEVAYLGEGDNNCAYEINDQYIFRFPKHPKAERMVKTEIHLLNSLKTQDRLQIPNFEFIGNQDKIGTRLPSGNGLQKKTLAHILSRIKLKLSRQYQRPELDHLKLLFNRYDRVFVGYKKIPGLELSVDVFEKQSRKKKIDIAKNLASFLSCLHSFPVEKARELGVSQWNFTKEFYLSFYPAICQYVLPEISEDERKILLKFYEDFLAEPQNYEYAPSVIHGDLTFDHIIFSPHESQEIGIIDFGGVCIGDPDYDFFLIYSDYGLDFLQQVCRYYEHNLNPKILQKVQMLSFCYEATRVKLGKQRSDQYESERGWKTLKTLIFNLKDG